MTQDNKAIVKNLLVEVFGEEELSKLDSSSASASYETKSPSPRPTLAQSGKVGSLIDSKEKNLTSSQTL